MGGNPSLDRTTRETQLEQKMPDFEKLDNRFYDLKEADIEKAITTYIKANRRAFYFDGYIAKPEVVR